jgi:hypothetical protein
MRTSITRLIIAAAVASVTANGSPVARSLAAPPVPQESLPNRYEPPISETDFHLGDHQQLRGYFLDGSREPPEVRPLPDYSAELHVARYWRA